VWTKWASTKGRLVLSNLSATLLMMVFAALDFTHPRSPIDAYVIGAASSLAFCLVVGALIMLEHLRGKRISARGES
jgi:hypothetical protein